MTDMISHTTMPLQIDSRARGALAAPDRRLTGEPLSVLHVIHPCGAGGADTVVRVLASAQKSCGVRVAVAGVVQDEGEAATFFAGLEEESIETHRIVVPGRAYLRERRAIAAIFRAMAPAVIHTHGYRADIVEGFSLRNMAPIVSTAHGYTGGDARNQFYERLQRWAFRHFDALVAVSAPLGRELEQNAPRDRVHVLPNAMPLRADSLERRAARTELGLPADDFIVGWVGRMSREKGPDVFVDALARPELPGGVHAAMLGDGPELPVLRQQAERLGIESRVSWLGRVPDAARYFAAFDALVLSSRTEGTPMVVLEAMAAGVPIVATRVGGVPDVLVPGTAFLAEPEAPAQLAAAIGEVFNDPNTARAVADAARERLENRYHVGAWVAAHDRVYRSARTAAARRFS